MVVLLAPCLVENESRNDNNKKYLPIFYSYKKVATSVYTWNVAEAVFPDICELPRLDNNLGFKVTPNLQGEFVSIDNT